MGERTSGNQLFFKLGIFADIHAIVIEKAVIKTEILQALSVEDVVCWQLRKSKEQSP